MTTKECIACGNPNATSEPDDSNRKLRSIRSCSKCGEYTITDHVSRFFQNYKNENPLLSKQLERYFHDNSGSGEILLVSSEKDKVNVTDWPGKVVSLDRVGQMYTDDGSALDKLENPVR